MLDSLVCCSSRIEDDASSPTHGFDVMALAFLELLSTLVKEPSNHFVSERIIGYIWVFFFNFFFLVGHIFRLINAYATRLSARFSFRIYGRVEPDLRWAAQEVASFDFWHIKRK